MSMVPFGRRNNDRIMRYIIWMIACSAVCCTAQFGSRRVSGSRRRNECVIPERPRFGTYRFTNTELPPIAGQIAPHNSVLEYVCEQGYGVDTLATMKCHFEGWSLSNPPKCGKMCPKLESKTHDLLCTSAEGMRIPCDEPIAFGGGVQVKCKQSYEFTDVNPNRYMRCDDGEWQHPLSICERVCGKRAPRARALVVGGNDAGSNFDFPWHAALYLSKTHGNVTRQRYICGATIISPNLILTAGHCVQTPNRPQLYWIGAGKMHRLFNDSRDQDAQYRRVKAITLPPLYIGSLNGYSSDIAALVLDTPLEVNALVVPACIDYHDTTIQPADDLQGAVAGWGLMEEQGNLADELHYINMPVVVFNRCIDSFPEDFVKFVTFDKFCAGYTNGTNVCVGDGGGGFVYRKSSGAREGRYFLRGIVSIGFPKEFTCDSSSYSLYTDVNQYSKWITDIQDRNQFD